MTTVVTSISEWQSLRASLPPNKTIGLVPTMGNLHAGHESLLLRSSKENNISVMSLFINPTQFNNPEDLKKYPRTADADIALAKAAGTDYILIPDKDTLYQDRYTYKLLETEQSCMLEGKHRPGHFDGVLTIVMKLFMLVKPTHAYFGEKDFQQLQLIQGMARAFFLDINIVPCPTVRNEAGLALSSRNNRLNDAELKRANQFAQIIQSANNCIEAIEQLNALDITVDYIEDLKERRYAAATVGQIRLIDNFQLTKRETSPC